jgi:hypothetical protein
MTEVLTQEIGTIAYNNFQHFSLLSYNCIKYMMDNNELVWKLLKYTSPDAWSKPDLTQEEKGALIYAGQQDSSKYNVFMDGKQPDVLVNEITMVRIMPQYAVGQNRTIGVIEISMEVFSHYKINHMSNYTTRIDTIAGELLALFNGVNVGTLGLMAIDRMIDQSSRLFQAGQIPFGGKQIIFATYSA